MTRYQRRHSLRRKIQNSIIRSTFISHLFLACILIPSVMSLIIPVGQIMTRGVAFELVQRYSMTDTNKMQKAQISQSNLAKYSEEQLIQLSIDKNKASNNLSIAQEQIMTLEEEFSKFPNLMVDPKSDDIKRLIVVSSEQYEKANSFFDAQLPFLKIYTMDFQVKQYGFFLPDEALKPSETKSSILDKFIDGAQVDILVTDMENIPVGYIKIGINPNLVSAMIVPYILLVVCVSFGSLFLVSILGKFMTAGILKPVKSLNLQLKAMAEDDIDNLVAPTLNIKRAPTEISELLSHANRLLEKMMDNKALLESQNVELHTQNEELIETKGIIQKQQNMLVQNEKMASIGQLSAAIVHEINTPVGAIKSNAQMVQMLSAQLEKQELSEAQLKPLEKIKMLNDIILQASDRVTGIIKSLKSYSRLDQSDFKASNLNEDLQNVLLLTSNLWKNKIQIEENYGDIPMVKCYSGLLNQVFMNLVVNAIDAMEEQGTLTLTTSVKGDNVAISIKDTGTGIHPDHTSRIFDEGFTTKSKNKGSGLGLALSKDIIDKHNGRIEVITELGKGSTFTVFMPLSNDQT